MRKASGIIYVLTAASSYGIMVVFVKLAYAQGFSVADVLGGEFFISLLLLWSVALYKNFLSNKDEGEEIQTLVSKEVCFTDHVLDYMKEEKKSKRINLKNVDYKGIARLVLIGMVGPGLTAIFYFEALSMLPASLAIFLLFQFSSVAVILDWIVTRKSPNFITITSLGFIIAGTFLGVELWNLNSFNYPLRGLSFGLASAITFAIFLYFTGGTSKALNPWFKSSFMITGAASIVMLFYQPRLVVDSSLNIELLVWIIPIAIFGQIIPNLFFNIGLPVVGGKLGSFLGTAELPSTILLASIFLGEKIGIVQWIGMIAIIIGIYIVNQEEKLIEKVKAAE